MNLQVIKSVSGKNEYVLLPYGVYNSLREEIETKLRKTNPGHEYAPFDPADYVDNPIALSRIKKGLTQQQLANLMKVSQAYISKIEKQENVTAKLVHKIKTILEKQKA